MKSEHKVTNKTATELKPEHIRGEVTLTLNMYEAAVLYMLSQNIGGLPDSSFRDVFSSRDNSLEKVLADIVQSASNKFRSQSTPGIPVCSLDTTNKDLLLRILAAEFGVNQ